MELKEMIKVMQHFEDGGEVEYSNNNFESTLGCASKKRDGDLTWDWGTLKYRIKEPKQKVTIEKWLCRDYHGIFIVIETTGIDAYYYEKVKLIESYEVEL